MNEAVDLTRPKMTQAFNQREYRNALARFATGVTVVTALENGKTHGMTANAFVSLHSIRRLSWFPWTTAHTCTASSH